MPEIPEPETYVLSPTPYVPNSRLPIVVYRNVLSDTSPAGILSRIEPNDWLKGGQWTTYGVAHFHSNTHECYAVIKGSSTYSLGKSPLDEDFNERGEENGMKLSVAKGDVFVLPAGISHRSIDSEGEYEFIGLYPKEDPPHDMNWCKASKEETEEKAESCRNVPIPALDPVFGAQGRLPQLWKDAAVQN